MSFPKINQNIYIKLQWFFVAGRNPGYENFDSLWVQGVVKEHPTNSKLFSIFIPATTQILKDVGQNFFKSRFVKKTLPNNSELLTLEMFKLIEGR